MKTQSGFTVRPVFDDVSSGSQGRVPRPQGQPVGTSQKSTDFKPWGGGGLSPGIYTTFHKVLRDPECGRTLGHDA